MMNNSVANENIVENACNQLCTRYNKLIYNDIFAMHADEHSRKEVNNY